MKREFPNDVPWKDEWEYLDEDPPLEDGSA